MTILNTNKIASILKTLDEMAEVEQVVLECCTDEKELIGYSDFYLQLKNKLMGKVKSLYILDPTARDKLDRQLKAEKITALKQIDVA